MARDLIVSSNPRETRVALLEDGVVAELFLEREAQRGIVGSIYKGRITRVLPGMQSAFVDLGLERDAFLHASDAIAELPDNELSADEVSAANRAPIEERLHEGEELVVQVLKEPMGTKGARITSHVSLPGRQSPTLLPHERVIPSTMPSQSSSAPLQVSPPATGSTCP